MVGSPRSRRSTSSDFDVVGGGRYDGPTTPVTATIVARRCGRSVEAVPERSDTDDDRQPSRPTSPVSARQYNVDYERQIPSSKITRAIRAAA